MAGFDEAAVVREDSGVVPVPRLFGFFVGTNHHTPDVPARSRTARLGTVAMGNVVM